MELRANCDAQGVSKVHSELGAQSVLCHRHIQMRETCARSAYQHPLCKSRRRARHYYYRTKGGEIATEKRISSYALRLIGHL